MVIEVGTTAGYAADLLSVKVLKSIVTILMEDTFDSSGLMQTVELNEISILTGGSRMAQLLESHDKKVSKKHFYIVTKTAEDANIVEDALLRWVYEPEQLAAALKVIDPDFNSFCWGNGYFDMILQDISDVLAASLLVFPGEAPARCYRGAVSWIES